MSDLVQLEEKLLAHDLESADFLRVLLFGQVHLAIATLPDLCKDLEITVAKSGSPFPQIGSFSSKILVPGLLILFR